MWAILRQNVGHFNRRVRGKKLKNWCYISRTWPDVPLHPICTNFGLRVRLVDIINCAKLYRNRLRGLDSLRGQILTIPILDCDFAVNTGRGTAVRRDVECVRLAARRMRVAMGGGHWGDSPPPPVATGAPPDENSADGITCLRSSTFM